jgi:hypothetical protein
MLLAGQHKVLLAELMTEIQPFAVLSTGEDPGGWSGASRRVL